MPDGPMMPEMAYEIVHVELMLHGNARLVRDDVDGAAAEKMMAECFDKNMIDKD